MTIKFETAEEKHFNEVLTWLQAEELGTGGGFYCNREVIAKNFIRGSGICSFIEGSIVGFSIFQTYEIEAEIHIIEVHPKFRGKSIGSQLLSATVEKLRFMGVQYIDVECTSQSGEALCRANGFEDYKDPENHRSVWDNPTLRRYLSDWRPPVKPPWDFS